MREGISRFDDFFAQHVNGYIFLFSNEQFSEVTKSVKDKFGEMEWTQFRLAVSTFSRLTDEKRHAMIERETFKTIQDLVHNNPHLVPKQSVVGKEAINVASTFIEACTSCPASKGLFTCEELTVDGRRVWVLREYYPQSLSERLINKKRVARTVSIVPSKIEQLSGNSMHFRIRVRRDTFDISQGGIRLVEH